MPTGNTEGRSVWKRRRSQQDFTDEINAHLQLEADDLEAEGASSADAQRRAKVAFGNVVSAGERFSLRNRILALDHAVRDLRFAARQLARNLTFAITAIFVLALGIGAGTAIFAFVDAA